MAKVSFVVTGFKGLDRALAGLKSARAKSLHRRALRLGMKEVLAEARATIPSQSGNWRKNLALRAMRRSRKRLGVVLVNKPDAYYGSFVEMGWKTAASRIPNRVSDAALRMAGYFVKSTKQTAKQTKVKGRWYMRTAARRAEPAALRIYLAELRRLIDAECRR